jgi:hypothetical protein
VKNKKGLSGLDEKILNLILENQKEFKTDFREEIKQFKADVNSKFENIENAIKEINKDVIKKKDCEDSRLGCTKVAELEVVRSEWSYKKIIAVGGVITATLTGSTVAVTTILKAIYG